MSFWWLSFADGGRPKGQQFLGVVVTDAPSFPEAVRGAWVRGINPGGEVQGLELPDDVVVPEIYRDRLLTRAEAEQLDQFWAAGTAGSVH